MKKHLTRAFAMLLVLAMILTMLPVMAFATRVKERAEFFQSGIPGDGKYGVIYSCGEGYSCVMGYSIIGGDAGVKSVELEDDGRAIKSLPDGTMVIKFVKTGDDYYFMVGNKYLVLKDLDSSNKEKLVLSDTAEKGAKWTIQADAAGMEGAYNIINAEYKWNGKNDVYLEQYNNSKFCGYSYNQATPQYFQFKFAETSADEDGRVGDLNPGDPLPAAGDVVVIYNDYAKACFGQPTTPDEAAKINLKGAPTVLNSDKHSVTYENIGDGALIFTVSLSNGVYQFKSGDRYLGMSENKLDESSNKLISEESVILIDAADMDKTDEQGVKLSEYTKWTVSELNGGWLMKNKTAVYKGYPVYVEYFDDLFAGYSFDSSREAIFAMNFYKVEDKYNCGYVVNPRLIIEAPFAAIGKECPVKFTVDDLNELKTIEAQYYITDNSGKVGAAKTVTPTVSNKVGSFTIPAADLEGASKLTVQITATDSMELTFRAEWTGEVQDEPLILAVTPAANTATGEEKRPEITASFANVGRNPTFDLKLDGAKVNPTVSGDKLSYKPAADLADGKHNLSLTITRADKKSVVKNWSFFIGAGGETLYFGQIHAHTAEYSDGAGTLEQAYEHAYGVDDMDFIIITDHSNYFDTTSSATESSYYDLSSLSKNPAGDTTKWEEARATAKEYNEKYDDFLCVYGYEMTWSGGPGHTNSFNTYGVVSRNNKVLNGKTNWSGMHRYNDLMVNADKGLDVDGKEAAIKRDGEDVTGVNATKYIPFDEDGNAVPVVSQFNHPGITFGNFGNYAGYTAQRDDILNLIEVGNGEGKVGGSSYFPSYSEYDLCLSMGWHVGPTNNQDNHKGNWGDSNTCRDVILTDDFSEIGLYRALDARRIYATEDQNLEIYYELVVDGQAYKLGDIAAIDDDKQPEKVTAKITVNDPDSNDGVGTVYIIGENGKELWKKEVAGSSFSEEVTINNDNAYYYIKVVEADGDIAVTAPVWTKESIPAGVEVKTDAAVAAQGVEENILATFTNGSETTAMTLKSYTITAEDKVVETKELNETLAAGKTKELTVPFTPSQTNPEAKKTYEIKAEFTFIYKEKEYTYSKTYTETSYPPSQMTYIGLDSGHKNFYVSGDYAGNETSFIQICADNGIICEYIKEGDMTAEKLSKYKLVVISTPRINETTQPPVFTAEELDALKTYTAQGGSIINLSKSDRYDYMNPAPNAALLAAVARAEALENLDAYTEASVAALQDALRAAKTLLENENATPDELDAATKALNAAIDGLTPKTGDVVYGLSKTVKTGDKVVLYNAGNGKAVTAAMSGYYLQGTDVTATDGAIKNPADNLIWTVTVNEDGSYTFRNGANVLAAGQSVNGDKTYNNLYIEEAEGRVYNWKGETINEETGSVRLYADGLTAQYGHVYLEWYANKNGFSAYDTSAERATEGNFGIRFYVEGAEVADPGPQDPDPKPEDPTPTEGTYVLTGALKTGDQVVIYNAGNKKAIKAELQNDYYLVGADVTVADGKISQADDAIVWTVTVNEDGTYTFTNGTNVLSVFVSGNYADLSLDAANHTSAWVLKTANAENSSFYMYAKDLKGQYGNVWMEYFKERFSAYSTSDDRVSETAFGLQFYVKTAEAPAAVKHDGVRTSYDPYLYSSATLSNSINEAIGAKARFVRGIVVDNEKKANEAYRIYFEGAELTDATHPFTKAVYRATNGQYQWYNGTGILPNGATQLVKPYDSSWVASYTANFDGSAYEPDYQNDKVMAKKGEFALVTYEELAGGGFLVCGGAAFISAYDLKTETPEAEQYENYRMVLNILEYVKSGNKVPAPEITPIKDVHAYGDAKGEAAATGTEFTVEGWITSNASDYDKDTAFFDCIYIQDETRGINAFPVSGYYYIGEKVQAHGAISYYCGEIELNLKPEYNGYIKVVENDLKVLEPAKVDCKTAMADDSIGNLMQISGTVKKVHKASGVVDYIYVDDGSGVEGVLFINNYIKKDAENLDNIQVGMSVTGVGIGSRDVDETGTSADGIIRRLRVRDREEIVLSGEGKTFVDVVKNAYYEDPVIWAVNHYPQITNGTDDTHFSPNATCTRAQVVTFLWRAMGEPKPTGSTNPFKDVAQGTYYYNAVLWAVENKITSGTSAATFSPNAGCTRAQVVTFLWRTEGEPKPTGSENPFADVPAGQYYTDAVLWAVERGITNGTSATAFSPNATCTRGQIVTFLYRDLAE